MVQNRKIPVSGFGHNLPHIIHIVLDLKFFQIFRTHKLFDRHTLHDQTRHGKRIVRRTNNDALFILRLRQYLLRHLRTAADDQTARVML